jgi:peptidoglycan hydrolase-like protein with peptidoglycan-binding domain
MLVRANSLAGCLLCDLSLGGAGSGRIAASVGAGGANAHADVLTIQKLLNGVAPEDGGPTPTLVEDGWIGPVTRGAIAAFQKRQKLTIQDDRIDPNGPTLRRLKELSSPFQRKSVLDQEGAARLKRVGATMAYLISASFLAERAIEAAMDYLNLGSGGGFGDANARAYRRANLYFKLGAQAQNQTIGELRFIRTTIGRVRTVLTSRSPFGAAIFDVDPLRTHPEYMAYSPMQLADLKRSDGTTSLRIYLCDGIDARPADHFAHILTHELFHFVDDETKERWIIDAPHGYRDGAMRLSHQQRMHNADNYALFVTHTAIGRARLIASQPMLAPYVPADMP